MTDLNSLLNTATGGHRPADPAAVDADVTRGRRALRSRRTALIGRGAFALVGPDGGTTVDPAVLEAPTMRAFLDHLQAQGDNGEGLR